MALHLLTGREKNYLRRKIIHIRVCMVKRGEGEGGAEGV
jgi:hypothetical protein